MRGKLFNLATVVSVMLSAATIGCRHTSRIEPQPPVKLSSPDLSVRPGDDDLESIISATVTVQYLFRAGPSYALTTAEARKLASCFPGMGRVRTGAAAGAVPSWHVVFSRANGTQIGLSYWETLLYDDGLGCKEVRGDPTADLTEITKTREPIRD